MSLMPLMPKSIRQCFAVVSALFVSLTPIYVQPLQQIQAISSVLSICQYPASISPQNLSRVLNAPLASHRSMASTLQGMVKTCSHGHASFDTVVVPNVIHVPCNYTPGQITKDTPCPFNKWANYADTHMTGHRQANYDYHIYVLPDIPGCRFGGMGTLVPCKPRCRVWVKGSVATRLQVYFHELGHNLGLHHAAYKGDEYGDLSSAMGYCCVNRCFSAPHSDALNWTRAKKQTTSKIDILLPNQYIRLHDSSGPVFVQFRRRDGLDRESTPFPFKTKFFGCVNVYRSRDTGHGVQSMLVQIICDKGAMWISRDKSITLTLLDIRDTYAKVHVNTQ